MTYTVLIPARYASTRFPGKPLADLGGKPMIVRVAERARAAGAARVAVATDDARIAAAVEAHGFTACMTRADHPTGTDRLAEAALQIGLPDDAIVVNVQGDEPLLEPALIRAMAGLLTAHPDAAMATACHPIADPAEAFNPNVVKVVLDRAGYALYFSRATIPWARDAFAADRDTLPGGLPLYRHYGLYAYRVGFLRAFPGTGAGADRAVRGAGAAARAVAWLPDRGRGHDRHARAGRRHARGSRAGSRALRRGRRRAAPVTPAILSRPIDRPADCRQNRTNDGAAVGSPAVSACRGAFAGDRATRDSVLSSLVISIEPHSCD